MLLAGRLIVRVEGQCAGSDQRRASSNARTRGTPGIEHPNPGHRRLKPIAGVELCRLLESKGWALQPVAGSHHIYSKAGERKIISVPVHGNRDLKPGLARRIARDADLDW